MVNGSLINVVGGVDMDRTENTVNNMQSGLGVKNMTNPNYPPSVLAAAQAIEQGIHDGLISKGFKPKSVDGRKRIIGHIASIIARCTRVEEKEQALQRTINSYDAMMAHKNVFNERGLNVINAVFADIEINRRTLNGEQES